LNILKNKMEYKVKGAISLDSDKLPNTEGVYLIKIPGENKRKEIDVYFHPIKGLCCYSHDFGSEGTGVDDSTDCHVSVQNTGLEFITKLREFD